MTTVLVSEAAILRSLTSNQAGRLSSIIEVIPMTTLRSCSLWCLALAVAAMPLRAQDERPSPPPRGIPDGTTFLIRLEDKLDASRVQQGNHFKSNLADDLTGPDETMLLRGSKIKGHVSAVGNGLHPRLLLSFDEIET